MSVGLLDQIAPLVEIQSIISSPEEAHANAGAAGGKCLAAFESVEDRLPRFCSAQTPATPLDKPRAPVVDASGF